MKQIVFILLLFVFTSPVLGGPLDSQFDRILDEYFKIQFVLTNDSTEGIDSAASSVVKLVSQTTTEDPELDQLLGSLKKSATAIQGQGLTDARNTFFDMSKPILVYLNKHYSGNKEFFRFYCSMAKKAWVQATNSIRNPYYGSSMLTCGELIQ